MPNAEQFRRWLEQVLELLQMRASPFATNAGVPVNAARKFLKGDQRDLRMDTASLLFKYAHEEAKARNVVLPQMEIGAAENCGGCGSA